MDGPGFELVMLELEPGEPISGRIRGPAGSVQSFRGWLELAGRLERLRASVDVAEAGDNGQVMG